MGAELIVAAVTIGAGIQQQRKAQKAQEKAAEQQFAAQKEEQKRRGKVAAIQQRRENFARLREVLAAQGEVASRGGATGVDLGATSAIQGGIAAPQTQFAGGIGVQGQLGRVNRRSVGKQNALLASATDAQLDAGRYSANAGTLFAIGNFAAGKVNFGGGGGGGGFDPNSLPPTN